MCIIYLYFFLSQKRLYTFLILIAQNFVKTQNVDSYDVIMT